MNRHEPKSTIACYYAHISALDEQLGRILNTLKELNLDEDTILVFTSDHGDMLWSQGMVDKEQPWEESIQIPFIIKWKDKVPEGRRSGALISTVDFAPTLLGLAGVEAPEHVEGTDLSAIALGERGPKPESVFLLEPVTVDNGFRQGLREWRGVRTKRYTYARWFNGKGWLLYDNETDPYQLNNLIDSTQASLIRDKLESTLRGWLERTRDECLPWDENIRRLDLLELWNARERELHTRNPRLLE